MRWLRIWLVFALVVASAACGRNGDDSRPARATPDATTEATDEPDGLEPGVTPLPGSTPGPTPAPTPTPLPPPPAPEGKANEPRTGDYVFDLTGKSTGPLDPAGRDYPSGTRLTAAVSKSGDVYTVRTSVNRAGTGTSVSRLRWSNDRVLLLSLRFENPMTNAVYECHLEPPIELLRFPLRAEAYPAQTGRGDDCSVSAEIRLVGREDATVPSGAWSTWKVESKTGYEFGSDLRGSLESVNWYSPDLGFEVKGDRDNQATYQGQSMSSTEQTALRSHP